MNASSATRLTAILVHHRNYPDVLKTVADAIACLPSASHLVVVDNSEDPAVANDFRHALPHEVSFLSIENKGYAHAVNAGIDVALSRDKPRSEYLLVLTHETRFGPKSVQAMCDVMNSDQAIAVTGPTLLTDATAGTTTWSKGGELTKIFNQPRHVVNASDEGSGASVPRDWVDGAFCLYRASALEQHRLREDFFLYFEETDLHTRFRSHGLHVRWVPDAVVHQSSNGAPPYLLARNLQKFQSAHGNWAQRMLSVPLVILRRSVRKLVRGGAARERRDLLRGWRDGIR